MHPPFVSTAGSDPIERHGGNLVATALRLGCRPDQLLDASASLVPFAPPAALLRALRTAPLRPYPDRSYGALRRAIARLHGLEPAQVLPGNGAAELFTWVARDAAAAGVSLLPSPGFADYGRALACWEGALRILPLSLTWSEVWPQPFPGPQARELGGDVLWITNPHNPTGQLWSRTSLEALLPHFALVIVDEAFLSLVPGGEAESLIPLVERHPQLVVIRSLTKLFAIAGLRLGYAVAAPERLHQWSRWRDPWPVNALAAAAGEVLVDDPRWPRRVRRWVGAEGPRLRQRLGALSGLTPLPSATNFLLVRGDASLVPLRQGMEQRHRVLLRDGRSFEGLGEQWLRIGLQDRSGNQRILRALAWELRAGL